jgi:hypothetical protein
VDLENSYRTRVSYSKQVPYSDIVDLACLRAVVVTIFALWALEGPAPISCPFQENSFPGARYPIYGACSDCIEWVGIIIASENVRGAEHRTWQLISLDGGTFEAADTQDTENEFGSIRQPGLECLPALRFLALLAIGTPAALGGRMEG